MSLAFAPKDRFILSGMQACFVRFKGTMEDLTRLLDLDGEEKGEPCPAVITQVTTYGGFGPTTLWTWLNARVARD